MVRIHLPPPGSHEQIEPSGELTTGRKQTYSDGRGTDGSNPIPSSGESNEPPNPAPAEHQSTSAVKRLADGSWRQNGLCQLSRLLIDDVSAILPRAQAVSRMPSAIAALRMCCQRRVAAGT